MVSNGLYNALEAGTELAVSAVRPNVSGKATLARVSGQLAGLRPGLANALKAFQTEEPQLDQRTQIEAERRRAIPGKLGRVVRIPGRALLAEDELAKMVNYTGELHRIAMERAIARNPQYPEGLMGTELAALANDKAAQKRAREHADRMTFQTPLGPVGNAGLYWLNKSKVGRILVPFVRTPTNILKRATEFSVAAPVMRQVREDIKAGGRARDLALGRTAIGSAFSMVVMSMVAEGLITGAGPVDDRERDLWMRTGKKPYSIKVGDQWIRYSTS